LEKRIGEKVIREEAKGPARVGKMTGERRKGEREKKGKNRERI
jgi:hypothetical protein